jgi:hypothetical protein
MTPDGCGRRSSRRSEAGVYGADALHLLPAEYLIQRGAAAGEAGPEH